MAGGAAVAAQQGVAPAQGEAAAGAAGCTSCDRLLACLITIFTILLTLPSKRSQFGFGLDYLAQETYTSSDDGLMHLAPTMSVLCTAQVAAAWVAHRAAPAGSTAHAHHNVSRQMPASAVCFARCRRFLLLLLAFLFAMPQHLSAPSAPCAALLLSIAQVLFGSCPCICRVCGRAVLAAGAGLRAGGRRGPLPHRCWRQMVRTR